MMTIRAVGGDWMITLHNYDEACATNDDDDDDEEAAQGDSMELELSQCLLGPVRLMLAWPPPTF